MLFRLWRDFWRNPWPGRFTVPLLLINFAGSIYGYYWYHQQLANTPFYFWPFVSDSPFSTTLFAVALLAYRPGRQKNWLTWLPVLGCVCCLKYGFWAVVLISHFWLTEGIITFGEAMLWLSHWGMVCEGWVYLRTVNVRRLAVVVTFAWVVVNDVLDYGLGLHPYLFTAGQLPVATVTAVGLTFVLLIILLVLFQKRLK